MLTTVEYLNDKSQFSSALNLTTPSGFDENGPIVANFCDFGIYGFFGPPLGEAVCKSASFDVAAASGFKLSTNDPATPHKAFIEMLSIYNEINWDLGDLTLTSITGYRDSDDLLDEDNIGAPNLGVAVFRAVRPQEYDQFTQEIRVASNYDGKFNFQFGGYYFHSSYTMNPADGFVFGGLVSSSSAGQISKSYAIFGEGYYAITDKLNFTGGFRWSEEKKTFSVKDLLELDPDGAGPGTPLDVQDAKASWSEPTWRISLDYEITDEVMVYVSYNRGFRSGGWNGRAVENGTEGPYDPEKVDSYEAGIRADLFDEHLRLNLTGFYVKYDNKQEEIITAGIVPGTTATTVVNASNAKMHGLELEFTGIVNERLSFRGSGSYQHSKYSSFLVPDPANPVSCGVSPELCFNNTDSAFRWSPKWTANIGGQYVIPVGNSGEVIFAGNLAYKSSFQTSPLIDPLGRSTVKPSTIVDFSLTYDGLIGLGDTNVRTSVYVKDAFKGDNRFGAGVDAGVFFFGVTAPGRVWGIELEADF
jgi:iron complex outermembrane receptor protein